MCKNISCKLIEIKIRSFYSLKKKKPLKKKTALFTAKKK